MRRLSWARLVLTTLVLDLLASCASPEGTKSTPAPCEAGALVPASEYTKHPLDFGGHPAGWGILPIIEIQKAEIHQGVLLKTPLGNVGANAQYLSRPGLEVVLDLGKPIIGNDGLIQVFGEWETALSDGSGPGLRWGIGASDEKPGGWNAFKTGIPPNVDYEACLRPGSGKAPYDVFLRQQEKK